MHVTPDEVHLGDPENYGKIYQVGTKYLKSPEFYRVLGAVTWSFGIHDPHLHRARRAALSPRFSRKTVLQLEAVVQSKTMKLCSAVADRLWAGRLVDVSNGFHAITVDIITDYAFYNCYNLLDQADLGAEYVSTYRKLAPTFRVFCRGRCSSPF